jgi:hypothetical protein
MRQPIIGEKPGFSKNIRWKKRTVANYKLHLKGRFRNRPDSLPIEVPPSAVPCIPLRRDLENPMRFVPQQQQTAYNTLLAFFGGLDHKLQEVTIKHGIVVYQQYVIRIILKRTFDAQICGPRVPEISIAVNNLDIGKIV